MAKNMKTRKGKDGFHYPYTSPDLVIDENGKSATKKFEEISSQFKDVANYSLAIGTDGLLYIKKQDGTFIGTGVKIGGDTDLSKVTMSVSGQTLKLLNNGEQITTVELPQSSSSETVNGNYCVQSQDLGEIHSNTETYDFRGWCPTSIQYSQKENKFIVMQYMSTGHLDSKPNGTTRMFKIDADTYEVGESKDLVVYESDGKTLVTVDIHPSTLFTILDDNTYLYYFYDDSTGSVKYHRIISTDNGATWKKTNTYSNGITPLCPKGWGIYKAHNGRLITGNDSYNGNGTKMYMTYSDDNGITWNDVTLSVNHFSAPPDEPCFILIPNTNKIIAIIRKSVAGNGQNSSSSTVAQPACYSISEDNGATWTTVNDSTTITNMNASDCCYYIEDDIIHLFVASRYYAYLTLYTEKGCCGQINHYYATIKDALNDNWTYDRPVINSQADYPNSATLISADFGAPGFAYNPNNREGLLMFFDLPKGSSTAYDKAVHRFARISTNLNFIPVKTFNSVALSTDANYLYKYFTNELNKRDTTIATLQYALSKIKGSDVPPPTGQIVYTFEWADTSSDKLYLANGSPFYGNMYLYNNYKSTGEATKGQLMKTFNTLHPTKPNFGIYIKCAIQTHEFAIGIVDSNNKLHGLSTYSATIVANNSKGNNTYNVPKADFYGVHEIEVNYNAGKYKLKIDGVEYSCNAWDNAYALGKLQSYYLPNATGTGSEPTSATPSAPNKTTPYIVIAYETNVLKISEFKYGEWDS